MMAQSKWAKPFKPKKQECNLEHPFDDDTFVENEIVS